MSELPAIARRALAHFGAERATLTLLNVSENATFLVEHDGERTVLRLHRPGYQTAASITSELAWLDALRSEAGVRTPRVVPSRDGHRLVSAADRHAVMFEWLPGEEPSGVHLTDSFEQLGAITARMHEHTRTWTRPAGFTRFAWDYDAAFGREARWGRWQNGFGVGPAERDLLGRLDATLAERLRGFGAGPQVYGLVHADLRLANLLRHQHDTYVIDFDDCGWSWYLYDLAAALSFIEDDPRVPELVDAWLRGYRRVRPLSAAQEATIPTFIMMRRLLLVAWLGSHHDTDLARSLGAGYTTGTCALAERYLTT
jgi:Ser/Thr protein kinase RdoA (MazF antagonist)